MLYWLTGTAGSSARIYYEGARSWGQARPVDGADRGGRLPRQPHHPARRRTRPNIVRWTEFDRGGHFAAMEAPDLLVGDIRAFFRRFR